MIRRIRVSRKLYFCGRSPLLPLEKGAGGIFRGWEASSIEHAVIQQEPEKILQSTPQEHD